jgi:hypothetical protein
VLTFSAGGDGGTGLKSAALDGGCRAAPSAPIVLGWSSDPDSGRVFVRHEPNLPSGGLVADIEIGAFLIVSGNGPEEQELLRLIGKLV